MIWPAFISAGTYFIHTHAHTHTHIHTHQKKKKNKPTTVEVWSWNEAGLKTKPRLGVLEERNPKGIEENIRIIHQDLCLSETRILPPWLIMFNLFFFWPKKKKKNWKRILCAYQGQFRGKETNIFKDIHKYIHMYIHKGLLAPKNLMSFMGKANLLLFQVYLQSSLFSPRVLERKNL